MSFQVSFKTLYFSPSYATNKVLERAGMTKDDIDVYEFHEAFAGQILAVLNALKSESFCKNYMGRSEAVSLKLIDL